MKRQMSADRFVKLFRQIFCEACDLLGIEWRVMNAWNISVARRASVARLDEFIGPKT